MNLRTNMRKSITSRIRITRRGKMMRRPMSVNHFRTRKSTNNVRGKRKRVELNFPMKSLHSHA